MRITYDKEADAVYVYLGATAPGEVVGPRAGGAGRTVDTEGQGLTMLDYDAAGRLRGVEVLNASTRLAPDVLARAERIDREGSQPAAARSSPRARPIAEVAAAALARAQRIAGAAKEPDPAMTFVQDVAAQAADVEVLARFVLEHASPEPGE